MSNETNSTQNFEHLLLPPIEWTLFRTGQSIIYSIIVLCTIFMNFLVLLAFYRNSLSLRRPTHYFVANLALADFLVGVFSLPYLAVISVTLRWYFGNSFCYAWTIMHYTFCSSSILSTLAICLERFIGVRSPLKHLRVMNTRNIRLLIIATWLLAGVLSALPLFIWANPPSPRPLSCKLNLRKGHVIVASIGIFHTPATAMVVLYYLIWRSATSSAKVMRAVGQDGVEDEGEQKKKQVRLAKKLAFPVGFMIVSYFPMFTALLVLGFFPSSVPPQVFIHLAWFRYFNSCVNPIIYAYSVPGFKTGIQAMFSWRKERRGSTSSLGTKSIRMNSTSTLV